ncbi:MAG: M20/M25/M40 family metallo-hydrolase [Alphaproteobacteria bacterium]|nr:M20/M25/M40 family metallo-hydrolase [Alphaproteobacteria bacterium]
MPIDIAALQPNADRLVDRLEILAKCSEPGDRVTRRYLTPGHRQAADLLLAAAELFLKIETIAKTRPPMVATVGKVSVAPGAGNVMPGDVEFTVDLRSPSDELRQGGLAELHEQAEAACRRRRVGLEINTVFESNATACAPWLISQFEQAIQGEGISAKCLPSGAGHDGIALADLTDIGMLFVRCEGGVSHDPAEYVAPLDIEAALRVMLRFVAAFRPEGLRR